MKCSACGNELVDNVEICPECGNKINGEVVVDNTVNPKKGKKKAIIAFILALIPYLLFLFWFVSPIEDKITIVGFICVTYCIYCGLPILIISIIMALLSKKETLSKITLVIDAIPIIIIIIVIITHLDQIIINIGYWMQHHLI